MKIPTDATSPMLCSSETCDSFIVAFNAESIFETTHAWTEVISPLTTEITRSTSSLIKLYSKSITMPNLITTGTFVTTYTCSNTPPVTVTILPSTCNDQSYDLSTGGPTTTYTVPAFSLSPTGSAGTISYSDFSPVAGVNFDTTNRIYNWVSLTTPGSYTLTV